MDQAQPVFYYDLGSPYCYLAAEAIMATLPVAPEWEPVLGSEITPADAGDRDRPDIDRPDVDRPDIDRPDIDRPDIARAQIDRPHDRAQIDRPHDREQIDRAQIERDAAELGLQAVRWPSRWPPDSARAMLAATYAKRIGRAVAFSLAAFRQAFAAGRDLGEEDTILIAGAACEMHPSALHKAIELASTATALRSATDRARRAGATALPAIEVGDRVYAGAGALRDAVEALEHAGVPR